MLPLLVAGTGSEEADGTAGPMMILSLAGERDQLYRAMRLRIAKVRQLRVQIVSGDLFIMDRRSIESIRNYGLLDLLPEIAVAFRKLE